MSTSSYLQGTSRVRKGLLHTAQASARRLQRVRQLSTYKATLVVPAGSYQQGRITDSLGLEARDGLARAHVGIQVQRLTERQVQGPVPLANGRGERSLQPYTVANDRVQGLLADQVATWSDRMSTDSVMFPFDRNFGRLQKL